MKLIVVAHADEVLAVPVRVPDHGQSVKVAEPVALDGAAAGRHELHPLSVMPLMPTMRRTMLNFGLGAEVLRDGVGLRVAPCDGETVTTGDPCQRDDLAHSDDLLSLWNEA